MRIRLLALCLLLLTLPARAADKRERWIEKSLRSMSLDEKVGQVLFVSGIGGFKNQESEAFEKIRTNIVDTSLRVPARFDEDADAAPDGAPTPEAMAAFVESFRRRVERGIDPRYVGELVREGIEENWDYIFTETEYE